MAFRLWVHIVPERKTKMEMCYNGTLVMPNNYAVVTEEEMTYVEGGISPAAISGMIVGLIGCGYSVMSIGKECGKYCYNNGYARRGLTKTAFSVAAVAFFGATGAAVFNIGFDNGWVEASKKK